MLENELASGLAAIEAEAAALDALLASVPPAIWGNPTRLPGWDVTTLTAHMVRGLARIRDYAATPLDEPPQKDRVSYWRYDAITMAPAVSARALEAARGQTPSTLRAEL